MVKSIHDLSEEEIGNLSKEIKELLKDFKEKKDEKKSKDDSSNWDDYELSSWLTSTGESKETNEIPDSFAQNRTEDFLNSLGKNISLNNVSLGSSDTYNIEDLIRHDQTLIEVKNLMRIVDNDENESVSKGKEMPGSSASSMSPRLKKKPKKYENSSSASNIVTESPSFNSDVNRTVETDLWQNRANEHTTVDKKFSKKKVAHLKFDSKSKNNIKSEAQHEGANVSRFDGSDLKNRVLSNTSIKNKRVLSTTSIKNKRKLSNRELMKPGTEQMVKQAPYTEGSPEYIKGHYVPIISKKIRPPDIETRSRVSTAVLSMTSTPTEKRKSVLSEVKKSEEIAPLFPLKIDRISMFSDDEAAIQAIQEEEEEEVEEEDASYNSGSDPGDPELMLKGLRDELLLPTDESDLDLDEFYKQFPKLNKNRKLKKWSEENVQVFFREM